MEGVDHLPLTGDERHVGARRRRPVGRQAEVRELRRLAVVDQQRDLERFEHGLIERPARGKVGHAQVRVVDDDLRPIPLHGIHARHPTASLELDAGIPEIAGQGCAELARGNVDVDIV